MSELIIQIVGMILQTAIITVYGMKMYSWGKKAGGNEAVIHVCKDNEIIEEKKV